MLRKKKAFLKIALLLLVVLGGVFLPNIFTNAASDYDELNYVIYIVDEDVEYNYSYIRILYYINEDKNLTFYENSHVTYINNNYTSYNLLGYDYTLYCVNAILNNNNIIISDIYYYEEFVQYKEELKYNAGYENGYINGENQTINNSYNEGYDNGYNEGYNVGNSNGYDNGYNEGNNVGYRNGFLAGEKSSEDNFSILSLLSLILMYPFKVIALGMDIEIFGINVGAFIIALLVIGFVAGIITIIRGGKNEK